MLFESAIWPRLADGSVTVAYRSWKRPTVKAGGTLRSPVGMLAIEAVDVVSRSSLTDADARAAGASDVDALLSRLPEDDGRHLYRIRFYLAGDDPRVALREDDGLTDDDVAVLSTKLDRSDARSSGGPWTRRVLALIAANPAVRSTDLCGQVDMAQSDLKKRVRRLKELGLTESLERGYRLSPRGVEFLRRTGG